METSTHGLQVIEGDRKPGFVLYDSLDKALGVAGIFFATNTLETIFNALNIPDTAVTPFRYLVPAVIVLRLAARFKPTLKVLQSDPFLLGLNVLIFLSYLWSVRPDVTLTGLRSEYAQSVIIAVFLATRFSLTQQVRLVSMALGLSALVSLIYVFAYPGVGVHQTIHIGAWRGVFSHKNYFSSVMALGAASFFVQLIDAKGRRSLWQILGLGLCVFLNLMSNSKTGQVLLVMVLVIIFIYQRYRWRGMKTVLVLYVMVATATAALFVLFTAWDQVFTTLGRDPTLTGRTIIWDILRANYIGDRLFWGYGLQAFWRSGLFTGLVFEISHAHNGWYDMILDVGMVGFALFWASALWAWVRVLRLAYQADRGAYFWPLAFLTVMFLNNITESLMLYRINVFWTLYMAICWSLKETIRLHK